MQGKYVTVGGMKRAFSIIIVALLTLGLIGMFFPALSLFVQ